MRDLSPRKIDIIEKLSRCMGFRYVVALGNPDGWSRVPGLSRNPGTEREGEIVLTKPVAGTPHELRIARWDCGVTGSNPFRYSIEVGAVGNLLELAFGAGMTGPGEPLISGPFEAAFARIS